MNKRGRGKKRPTKKIQNNQQNGSKNTHSVNYLKYKWIKSSNQKTETGWMDAKTRPMYVLSTRPTSDLGTHAKWKWGDGKRYSRYTKVFLLLRIFVSMLSSDIGLEFSLFGGHLCLVLVLRWWLPYKKSLGMFLLPQYFGIVSER